MTRTEHTTESWRNRAASARSATDHPSRGASDYIWITVISLFGLEAFCVFVVTLLYALT